MGLKPLHDWVLIRRDEPEETTSGGIIIPDAAKNKPSGGVVLAVGPGKFKKEPGKKEKKFIPTVLREGERIMFIDYMARDVEIGDESITLIREEDVLGTVEGSRALEVKPNYHIERKDDRPPMVVQQPEARRESGREAAKPLSPEVIGKNRTVQKKSAAAKGKSAAPAKEERKEMKTAKKKTTTKKAAPKKAAKKTVAKKTAKKAAPKKAVAKKTAPKKSAKKTAAKKTAKKAAPKKAVAKKTAPKKSAKKTVAKKTASKAKSRAKK